MRITNSIKKAVETTTIQTFLYDYLINLSYEEIVDSLNDADSWADLKSTFVWEPFKNYEPQEVAGFIESLYENTIQIFKEVK